MVHVTGAVCLMCLTFLLRIMHLDLIHMVACLSFASLSSRYVAVHCMKVPAYVCPSSADGQLDCLSLVAIVNSVFSHTSGFGDIVFMYLTQISRDGISGS